MGTSDRSVVERLKILKKEAARSQAAQKEQPAQHREGTLARRSRKDKEPAPEVPNSYEETSGYRLQKKRGPHYTKDRPSRLSGTSDEASPKSDHRRSINVESSDEEVSSEPAAKRRRTGASRATGATPAEATSLAAEARASDTNHSDSD